MNSSNGCGAGGARPPTAITATPVRAKAIASALPMKPLPPRIRTVSATVVLREKALIDAMITMGTVVPGPNLRGHPSSSGFSEGGVGVGNFQTIAGCCQFAGRVAEQSGFAVGDDTGVVGHVRGARSEARRVGKECVRRWRSRGSLDDET